MSSWYTITDQLKAKDEQIASAHQLADQAQKLHLGLEGQVKALTGATDKPIVDGETSEIDKESIPSQSSTEEYSDPKATTKKGWWRLW